MSSSSFGEFDLIARLRRGIPPDPRVPLGIGDDAAVLSAPAGGRWLVAADMLLEGRHFTADTPPRLIGRKAIAVNVSDIAAMAGKPVAAFVTVAHNRGRGPEFAEEIHRGLADLAREYDIVIAGGDTNVWDGPVVVSVTLLGETIAGRAVTRGGAKVGDRVFVTGPLGGSLASGRHLSFPPRVAEAVALHAAVDLHAMIDVSDGLLSDLGHVCEESGVGIVLVADGVPINDAARAATDGRSALEHALTDGEDFELAFCIDEADAARIRDARGSVLPAEMELFEVGEVTAGRGVTVVGADGRALEFSNGGWAHQW